MLPRDKIAAAAPLMRMANAATTITVAPATGCGANRRSSAAQAMAPVTTRRIVALISAAMIDDERKP